MHVLPLLLIPVVLMASGCDQRSPLAHLSDYELSEKHDRCLEKRPTAPGAHIACENYKKECEKRRNELGSYVC